LFSMGRFAGASIGGSGYRALALLAAVSPWVWLSGTSAAEQPPLIAVFTKNTTNPAYENFRIGADKAAAAGGARTKHYVPVKPDNVDEQKALIEQALADKPDVVLFIAVDDTAMVEPLKTITDAHIPVVTAVSRIEGRVGTFVGSDDAEVGRREARYLFEKMGGAGKIVILEGIPSSPTSRDRKRGYEEVLKAFPRIEVLESRVANYQRPDAQRVMTGMFGTYPQIDGILAANDAMALGALDVARKAGKTPLIVGINGLVETVQRIADGEISASVDFSTFNMACVATAAALRNLRGESSPPNIILPAELIDRTNYKTWLTPTKDRSCPSLDAAAGPR
jgi:ribose transport system substrate-binding protein